MVSQGPSKDLHVRFTIKHSLLPSRREKHKYNHKMPQTKAEWPHSGCDGCSPTVVNSRPTAPLAVLRGCQKRHGTPNHVSASSERFIRVRSDKTPLRRILSATVDRAEDMNTSWVEPSCYHYSQQLIKCRHCWLIVSQQEGLFYTPSAPPPTHTHTEG